MPAPTAPADTQLPQITGSPRDVVEVKSALAPVPEPVPARRTPSRKDQLLKQANAESERMRAQLQQIQDALQQERVSRLTQVEEAKSELAGVRRQLDAAEIAQMRERRFLRRTARILLPAGVTVLTISAVFIFALHVDWRSMSPPPAPVATAQHSSVEPAKYTDPPPASPDDVDLSSFAARGVDRVTPEALAAHPDAAEAYEMARLNGALEAVPQTSVPSILTAVNKWLRTTDGTPCWVQSPSGTVSLAISPQAGSHPLLSAFSRCADAVEHVTHQ